MTSSYMNTAYSGTSSKLSFRFCLGQLTCCSTDGLEQYHRPVFVHGRELSRFRPLLEEQSGRVQSGSGSANHWNVSGLSCNLEVPFLRYESFHNIMTDGGLPVWALFARSS